MLLLLQAVAAPCLQAPRQGRQPQRLLLQLQGQWLRPAEFHPLTRALQRLHLCHCPPPPAARHSRHTQSGWQTHAHGVSFMFSELDNSVCLHNKANSVLPAATCRVLLLPQAA